MNKRIWVSIALATIAAVDFGLWQQSLYAGGFMGIVLFRVLLWMTTDEVIKLRKDTWG